MPLALSDWSTSVGWSSPSALSFSQLAFITLARFGLSATVFSLGESASLFEVAISDGVLLGEFTDEFAGSFDVSANRITAFDDGSAAFLLLSTSSLDELARKSDSVSVNRSSPDASLLDWRALLSFTVVEPLAAVLSLGISTSVWSESAVASWDGSDDFSSEAANLLGVLTFLALADLLPFTTELSLSKGSVLSPLASLLEMSEDKSEQFARSLDGGAFLSNTLVGDNTALSLLSALSSLDPFACRRSGGLD